MRQWLVDPHLLCRKHLLGEHVEHHMFVGTICRGKSVAGYLRDGLLEPKTLQNRHTQLVTEMIRRGYNHRSPLPNVDVSHLPDGEIDIERNIADLRNRCEECAGRINSYSWVDLFLS
jgi:hypothetical protein|tara:strand:+ start:952 stop:1302 length:351 start_codon:yes stop_codon:yes gene_type:complete